MTNTCSMMEMIPYLLPADDCPGEAYPELKVVAPVRRPPKRRTRTAMTTYRRRRLMLTLVLAAVLVLLALPIRVLGGQAITSASPGTPPSAGSSGHGAVYVVQPGDTLWSIAVRVDPTGDPRPLVAQLAGEVGSDTVVPGEPLTLPV